MLRLASAWALAAAVAAGAPPARADDAEITALRETVSRLEQRVRELETTQTALDRAQLEALANVESDREHWADRVRIGGQARFNHLAGGGESPYAEGSTRVFDARLYVDARIARETGIGETLVFRSADVVLDYELVRLGDVVNRASDAYVDVRGLFDRDWLNLHVGRFQLPVGEYYLRFGRGRHDDPFISGAVGLAWWPDEGVKLFGSDAGGRFGYVTSLTNGEGFFQDDGDGASQLSLKLFANATEWLHLSVSGLRSGTLGSPTSAANSSLWFGEGWIRPFGSGTAIPSYQDRVVIPDGGLEIEDVTLLGGDVIVELGRFGRLWLAGGTVAVEDAGLSLYDRDLRFWSSELVLRGDAFARVLSPFQLALRANGIGTYDSGEGYLLDARYAGTLGYNMRSLDAYSIAFGWPINDLLTLRAEYTVQRIGVVKGLPDAIRSEAEDPDFVGVELGVRF